MTALKPIENRRVRGVAAESYPSNLICAHPECNEQVTLRPSGEPTVHHIFPRSLTKSSSYFVEIEEDFVQGGTLLEDGTVHEFAESGVGDVITIKRIIPHAVGLCGSGTSGHHGDVEEHRAWIKLEDGVYAWYDREECAPGEYGDDHRWIELGPLNPQPGSRDGKTKKKRTVKGTDERAARKTVSVRLPEGFGGDQWDELLEEAGRIELDQDDTQFDPAKGAITVGKLLVAVLERFTGRIG